MDHAGYVLRIPAGCLNELFPQQEESFGDWSADGRQDPFLGATRRGLRIAGHLYCPFLKTPWPFIAGASLLLRWRLLLGVVVVAALAALVWLDYRTPGVYLLPLALVVATLAAGEVQRLVCIRNVQPAAWGVYGGTLLVVAASGIPYLRHDAAPDGFVGPLGWTLLALMIFVGVALLIEIVRFEQADLSALRAALSVFAVAYAGGLLGILIHLRFVISPNWGAFALISLLVIVKMGDIGAYTVGRLVGRHKLAPKLSPGKTIEGFVGGLAFSAVSALVLLQVVAPMLIPNAPLVPWWRVVAFGLILGVAGTIGDLAESLLKRAAGVKDSSRWMPGYGGVLDMVDSLLLAAPVAYLLWIAGLVGPGM